MMTFSVLNINEGGDFSIDQLNPMWFEYMKDGYEKDFNECIEELKEYFEYDERDEEEIVEFNDMVEEFTNLYNQGDFKVQFWGVECDVNITLL
jgi:hypothetical protein